MGREEGIISSGTYFQYLEIFNVGNRGNFLQFGEEEFLREEGKFSEGRRRDELGKIFR